MKVASWNVNSIKARQSHAVKWLQDEQPDILFLQELKGVEENFPFQVFEDLGYVSQVKGQKAYNGVAILSKEPVTFITNQLPGFEDDEQARYLEVEQNNTHFINIYAPNGNPLGTEKFSYKLKWLNCLKAHLKELNDKEISFMIGGDFNIIPDPIDCENPADWQDDALFQPESRALYREMINMGLVDAYRALYPDQTKPYSFWGYQAGAWDRDDGIRIDHFLLSSDIAEKLKGVKIHKEVRGWETPSDHVPVEVEIE